MDVAKLITLCASVTGAMMAFGRYVLPALSRMLGFVDKYTELQAKVVKLETNHLAHVIDDIKDIKKNQETLFERIAGVENLAARVDERTKHI